MMMLLVYVGSKTKSASWFLCSLDFNGKRQRKISGDLWMVMAAAFFWALVGPSGVGWNTLRKKKQRRLDIAIDWSRSLTEDTATLLVQVTPVNTEGTKINPRKKKLNYLKKKNGCIALWRSLSSLSECIQTRVGHFDYSTRTATATNTTMLIFDLVLAKREGLTKKYWPDDVNEGQYSPVRLQEAGLVWSLFCGTSNTPGIEITKARLIRSVRQNPIKKTQSERSD